MHSALEPDVEQLRLRRALGGNDAHELEASLSRASADLFASVHHPEHATSFHPHTVA
jgi:hypothetical protein